MVRILVYYQPIIAKINLITDTDKYHVLKIDMIMIYMQISNLINFVYDGDEDGPRLTTYGVNFSPNLQRLIYYSKYL